MSWAYPTARAAAERVEPHFLRHRVEAEGRGVSGLAPLADPAAMEAMIEAAFWASLRREEGYVPTISLAFLPPAETGVALRFEKPLALDPKALTKLAPAVERPGIHLGVWRENGTLSVWGATRSVPKFGFVLEVAAPGLLVIKHRREDEAGKFVNVAVVEADQVKVLLQDAASLPDCPAMVGALLGFASPDASGGVGILTQLAISMREHRRGGLLLVVPAGSDSWRDSVLQPVSYSVTPPFGGLAGLMRQGEEARQQRRWQDSQRRAVDAVAGLTAVDGATVITDQYDVLAFGAKIGRRDVNGRVSQILATEPIEGSSAQVVEPPHLGGTRHLAAAQFVYDHHDALALVASQDGRFTVFAWSPCAGLVQAHSVEMLLL